VEHSGFSRKEGVKMKTLKTQITFLLFSLIGGTLFAEPAEMKAISDQFNAESTALKASYDADMGKLHGVYRTQLTGMKDGFQKSGNLDAVVSTQKEIDRFTANPQILVQHIVGTNPKLASLQGQAIKASFKIESSYVAKRNALKTSHKAALLNLQKQLVQNNQVDDAMLVKGAIEAVDRPVVAKGKQKQAAKNTKPVKKEKTGSEDFGIGFGSKTPMKKLWDSFQELESSNIGRKSKIYVKGQEPAAITQPILTYRTNVMAGKPTDYRVSAALIKANKRRVYRLKISYTGSEKAKGVNFYVHYIKVNDGDPQGFRFESIAIPPQTEDRVYVFDPQGEMKPRMNNGSIFSIYSPDNKTLLFQSATIPVLRDISVEGFLGK